MNLLTEAEIDRRLPVWEELSNLFLDTDYLEIVGPERVAAKLSAGGSATKNYGAFCVMRLRQHLRLTSAKLPANGQVGLQTR